MAADEMTAKAMDQTMQGTTAFGPAGTQESCAVLMLSLVGSRAGLVSGEVDGKAVCAGFRPGTRCETCAVTLSGMIALPAAGSFSGGATAIPLPIPALPRLGQPRAEEGSEAGQGIEVGEEPGAGEAEGEEDWRPLAWAAGLSLVFLGLGWLTERFALLPALGGIALYAVSYLAGGYFRVKEGLEDLRRGVLGIDFLMVMGAAGAAVLGKWEEGAILMFLFSLSAALEAFANGRTRQAIRKLMELSPEDALVRRDGRELRIPIADLQLGDLVIVKPGERFPADGTILHGDSSINEAAITGESMPVDKGPGSPVFAGTVNGFGLLEFEVSKPAGETALARIIRYVEDAQSQKASTQRMTDWIDRYYTLAVMVVSGLAFLLPPLLQADSWSHSFYRAMMLLVVASPCALVISTPAAILSGIARGARSGILIKGGLHLEQIGRISVVAFDKTGTLTAGRPTVVSVEPEPGVERRELLRLAAAAESRSEHPLAGAILRHADEQEIDYPTAEEFRTLAGKGALARVDGQEVIVGSSRILGELGVGLEDPVRARVDAIQARGWTDVVVAADGRVLGLIAIADTLRPAAHQAVAQLKKLGVRRVVMLTGDNRRAAETIGREAGVDEVLSELLPEDKWRAVRDLEQRYGPVAMVGDGVNDAPALAAATVGVAMGGIGSDVAMETADVVLMADDLEKLGEAIALGRRTRMVVYQNLVFAIGVILTLVAAVLLDRLTLPLAVVGHEGSTILVAFNGLRLLLSGSRGTPPRSLTPAPERPLRTA